MQRRGDRLTEEGQGESEGFCEGWKGRERERERERVCVKVAGPTRPCGGGRARI